MGCVNEKQKTPKDKQEANGKAAPIPPVIEKPKVAIAVNKARQQQGVRELKQNYLIDTNTQVLGSGAFDKVFKTHNIKDPNI